MTGDALRGTFWKRVKRTTHCWEWQGAVSSTGYGQCWDGSRVVGAHRLALQLTGRVISSGDHVHHSCGNTRCVRPSHLSVLDSAAHLRTHNPLQEFCLRGHPLSGANLYVDPRGKRRCRACRASYMRVFHARKRVQSDTTKTPANGHLQGAERSRTAARVLGADRGYVVRAAGAGSGRVRQERGEDGTDA